MYLMVTVLIDELCRMNTIFVCLVLLHCALPVYIEYEELCEKKQ
jgi:hypothetical protein